MGEKNNPIEIGQEASKLATLNSLSAAREKLGSLSKIKRVCEICGEIKYA